MGNNITMHQGPKYKVYFTRKAYQKYRYFIDLCPTEISGFGKVVRIAGKLTITDVEIFKQVVSGAHSDMDDDALAAFLYEKTKAKEDLSQWRVWWHSHASMQVFFSGTDTGTIDGSTEFPWLVSVVGNHAGDIKARWDLFDPMRHTEELEVEIIDEEDEELKALCKKEIDEKVSTHKYEPTQVSVGFQPRKEDFQHNHKKGKKRDHFWGGKSEDETDRFHEGHRR